MKVDGIEFKSLGVFKNFMTVPDCVVVRSNKIGTGNGEAKLYVASKEDMYDFYGNEKFVAHCFMLKRDLLAYMDAIRNEYTNPSQDYAKKEELPSLWFERRAKIIAMPDIIEFKVYDQYQITGVRGYVKSADEGYKLIREIALPLVSYIYVEKLGTEVAPIYYWKLFVDFDAIWEKKNGPLVFNYGRGSNTNKLKNVIPVVPGTNDNTRYARNGQEKYREALLEQCSCCPFTMISDERLLVASHIKPWVASNDVEKVDPYNGYLLSPLYDKLFDKGFITFTSDRHVILSQFISPTNWKRIGLKDNQFVQALPMDNKRIKYLEFHHNSVFKGYLT